MEDEVKEEVKEEPIDEVKEEVKEEPIDEVATLKSQIEALVIENAKLREERDQAHNAFLGSGKDVEDDDRSYDSLKKGIE